MTEKEYNLKVQECQEKSELKLSWIQFITQHFNTADWFGTLTFRDIKSPASAKRYFWKWLRELNTYRFGKHLQRQNYSVSWVLGEEIQSRGAIHYHCLVKNVDALMRNEWGKMWWTITRGYGKILPSSGQTAIQYISKYITKDGQIDLDIRDNTGQRLTLDVPRDHTEADQGRQEVLTGFYLPLVAN